MFLTNRKLQLYITANTVLWSIGFAIGLIFGFAIPIFGDMLAVLVVGLLVLITQSQALPDSIDSKSWIKTTFLGLVIGTAASFLGIILFYRTDLTGLGFSHVLAFPIILVGVIIIQSRKLSSTQLSAHSLQWAVYSLLGLVLGMLIISFLGLFIPLELEQLDVRMVNYAAVDNWALMGAILGICYGIFTALCLDQMENGKKEK